MPYVTQAYGVMVLEGTHGDGVALGHAQGGLGDPAARRHAPIHVDGWYPPRGVPAATTVDIQGDARPEIVVSLNDGFVYAFDADAAPPLALRLHAREGRHVRVGGHGRRPEPGRLARAPLHDLRRPRRARLGLPRGPGGRRTAASRRRRCPNPGHNGNGNGAPAAPTVGDLDGDGELEIFVQTFDHGMDVFTVPGSGCNCLLWATARGGPLRMGQPSTNGL